MVFFVFDVFGFVVCATLEVFVCYCCYACWFLFDFIYVLCFSSGFCSCLCLWFAFILLLVVILCWVCCVFYLFCFAVWNAFGFCLFVALVCLLFDWIAFHSWDLFYYVLNCLWTLMLRLDGVDWLLITLYLILWIIFMFLGGLFWLFSFSTRGLNCCLGFAFRWMVILTNLFGFVYNCS